MGPLTLFCFTKLHNDFHFLPGFILQKNVYYISKEAGLRMSIEKMFNMSPWGRFLLGDKDKDRSISLFLGKKNWYTKKNNFV